ncbi:MAG: hypothetical protein HY913_24105 [Desulfomonile tiedjei]|nr:hypothetical protein [Desulfomonile tiedjei]
MKALSHALILAAAILLPCAAMGQFANQPGQVGPPPTPYGVPGAGPLALPGPPVFGLPGPQVLFDDDSEVLRLYSRVGYQWMTFGADFPVPGANPATSVRAFDSMDLQLRDANVWVGFLGGEFRPVPRILFYGEMGASALRDATIKMNAVGRATDAAPAFDANLVSPWDWTATDFRWWVLDAGVAFSVARMFSVEFGFRTEHIDFRLTDPRNDTWRDDTTPPIVEALGRAITANRICPGCQGVIEGDPLSKIWDPYVGIRGMWKGCKKPICTGRGSWVTLSDPYLKWRVRGSPLVWNRWYSNIDFRIQNGPGGFPEQEIHRTVFSLNGSGGRWFEGDIEAFLNITPFAKAGFWAGGSWLDVQGTGHSSLSIIGSTIISDTRPTPLQPGSSDIPNSSFTQSTWSLGLSLDYTY